MNEISQNYKNIILVIVISVFLILSLNYYLRDYLKVLNRFLNSYDLVNGTQYYLLLGGLILKSLLLGGIIFGILYSLLYIFPKLLR